MANLGLVEHIVRRVSVRVPARHSRDDLTQSGMLGLIGAAIRFDATRGVAFSTFAGRRIEGAVIDALRKADWVPQSVRALERQLRAAEQRSGADRSWTQVARYLDLDPVQLDRLRRDLDRGRIDSLDRVISADGSVLSLADTIADDGLPFDDELVDREWLATLRRGVTELGERHRIVIQGYFFEGRTLDQLALLLDISPTRVSQLKEQALRSLREQFTPAGASA